ncbi:DUF721 domain-containing protein [Legionella fairfieldensis]|uniref:DUF721 domain-containing protein n=1 Tax=Legionella fairfieldensis TaxID=45064 RepID=UPI00048E112A|nr:DUF721 domain-containing protein [Legionella fairfieldensis]
MRPISHCLNSRLLDICHRATQLDDLNKKLNDYLPFSLIGHCQAGAFNRGCLLLIASNAAWATELRYYLPELRDKLRKAGLYQLTSIKIALAEPDVHTPSKQLNKLALSASARDSIRTAGELCSYQPLKDALYQLADIKAQDKIIE